MNITVTPEAKKRLLKLPLNIQKKTEKQFTFLISDYRYPSLHTRKMGGGDVFEARIDIHYRFTFQVDGENIYILTIGPHDTGLGKR